MPLVGAAAPVLSQERSLFDESQVQHLAALSSPGFEAKPDISHDLLTLHFASGQAGGVGDLDLWVAERPDVNSPFGAATNVAVLNSAWRDHTPTTNADGTLMIFSSNRPGGMGIDDAWMTTRPDSSSPWDPPTHLPGINSTERDMGFSMPPDGLHMYFASNRVSGLGEFDLYFTSRPDTSAPWSPPVPLSELNTPYNDSVPSVTGDELTLYFASNRPGSTPGPLGLLSSEDLWVAMRPDTSSGWSVVENVFELNTGYSDYLMSVSDDESELFFASDRPGSFGLLDLYHTRAIPNIRRYGAGTSGTAGVPRVRPIGGAPSVGNAAFAMEVTNVASSAWGVWMLGSAPSPGPILVSFAPAPVIEVFQDALEANPPPETPRIVPTPIPDNPSLIGVTWFVQFGVLGDPHGQASLPGPVSYAASPGIRGTVF
jgi:hypothetical protein